MPGPFHFSSFQILYINMHYIMIQVYDHTDTVRTSKKNQKMRSRPKGGWALIFLGGVYGILRHFGHFLWSKLSSQATTFRDMQAEISRKLLKWRKMTFMLLFVRAASHLAGGKQLSWQVERSEKEVLSNHFFTNKIGCLWHSKIRMILYAPPRKIRKCDPDRREGEHWFFLEVCMVFYVILVTFCEVNFPLRPLLSKISRPKYRGNCKSDVKHIIDLWKQVYFILVLVLVFNTGLNLY